MTLDDYIKAARDAGDLTEQDVVDLRQIFLSKPFLRFAGDIFAELNGYAVQLSVASVATEADRQHFTRTQGKMEGVRRLFDIITDAVNEGLAPTKEAA